jgi:hypothetical protein
MVSFNFCHPRLLLRRRVGNRLGPPIDYKSTVQVPSWAWMAYPAGWRSWSRQMRAVRVAVPKGLYFANVPIWATNDGRRLWVNVRELRDCERHSHGTVCEKNSRRVVGTLWAEQRSAEGTSFDGCVVVGHGQQDTFSSNPEVYVIRSKGA